MLQGRALHQLLAPVGAEGGHAASLGIGWRPSRVAQRPRAARLTFPAPHPPPQLHTAQGGRPVGAGLELQAAGGGVLAAAGAPQCLALQDRVKSNGTWGKDGQGERA